MTASLLLDSCAIIWLAHNSGKLSPAAREAIAAARRIAVSPVSLWEIALKCKHGKLTLPMRARDIFDWLVDEYSAEVMPPTLPIMETAAMLPEYHKDPADRFIIATALVNNCTLITADRRFATYGVHIIC